MDDVRTRIDAVRRFSRFYTKRIGLLEDGFLESPYSLTECRVVYEVAARPDATPSGVAERLGLDPGYLSRLLRRLTRAGLIEKRRSDEDGRRLLLALTSDGRSLCDRLDAGADAQVRELLAPLPTADQDRIVEALGTVERLLDDTDVEPGVSHERPAYTLRPHRPGDIGWVVQRHGELYHASHGWDGRFEAMCADIGARFLERYDPSHERSWIGEIDGERVGAVFLVRRSKRVGQLRFLFVEPSARGLGLGARLVSECVGHARWVGYRSMTLFTVASLDSARRLYEAEGFVLAHEEPGEGWAEGQTVQRWDLEL